jgi:3-oxoacyl-[acyl-carrier-protein] synthase II
MEQQRKYYLNGIGLISPQPTYDNSEFLNDIITYDKNVLSCVAPDFKEYLSPLQLRRLNRMLRTGLTAATICIRDSGRSSVDGIITATGYGFLHDTAVFLNEVLDQDEQHVAPTHFMQSTYNALSGLAALSIQCKGYNSTYVSQGVAFENALQDAFMQINENNSQSFLIGSYDEADETQYRTHLRAGYFKKELISSDTLISSGTSGTIQGEGASFFCVSGEPSSATWCAIVDIEMLYRPDKDQLFAAADEFIKRNNLSYDSIDLLISGASGDPANDALLHAFVSARMNQTPITFFKHLCGEYCTASSFAVWLGASVLKKQIFPAWVDKGSKVSGPQTVLIVNQYLGKNYSFVLLRKN